MYNVTRTSLRNCFMVFFVLTTTILIIFFQFFQESLLCVFLHTCANLVIIEYYYSINRWYKL